MTEKKNTTKKEGAKKEHAKKSTGTQKDKAKVIASLQPGMTVRIYQKIKELNAKGEEKERTQFFEGMILARKHGAEKGATVTVRKVSGGIGVEKIFPLGLPTIEKVEILKKARVRRAKLYYLRNYKKKLKEVKVTQ